MHHKPNWEIGKEHVDRLIAERAGALFEGRFGSAIRFCLHRLLRYREAVRIAGSVTKRQNEGPFELVKRYLSMKLFVEGAENIPKSGRFLIVVNHPTGIADGVIVYQLLHKIRPDMMFFANKDILTVVPGLQSHIIPVEWVQSKRSAVKSRGILLATAKACKAEKAIVLFPSGRMSYLSWNGLNERPWQTTAVSIARKFDLPIVPVHLGGQNSLLFYLFSMLANQLRDITLLRELLNKRHETIRVKVGSAVQASHLPADPIEATAWLQHHVEARMRSDKDPASSKGRELVPG